MLGVPNRSASSSDETGKAVYKVATQSHNSGTFVYLFRGHMQVQHYVHIVAQLFSLVFVTLAPGKTLRHVDLSRMHHFCGLDMFSARGRSESSREERGCRVDW